MPACLSERCRMDFATAVASGFKLKIKVPEAKNLMKNIPVRTIYSKNCERDFIIPIVIQKSANK
jgi:hypothetical protein